MYWYNITNINAYYVGQHNQVYHELNDRVLDLLKIVQSSDSKMARNRVREYNTRSDFQIFGGDNVSIIHHIKHEFMVFKTFFESRERLSGCHQPGAYIRYCCALMFALIGIIAFIFLLPTTMFFLIYSWFYPVVELVIALVQSNLDLVAIPPLSLCLTLAYLFIILLMICLAPNIYKFNRLCTDIVPLNNCGLPPCFYDISVVDRIKEIYESELCWQFLVSSTTPQM